MTVSVAQETGLTAEEYIWCVSQTTLGPTRPLGNPDRVQAYLDSSNIVISARDADGTLVGLFRGVTDWAWVAYCADLAVLEDRQGEGIGKALMDKASETLGDGVTIVLLSLPGAVDFYARIGLTQTDSAFYKDRTHRT